VTKIWIRTVFDRVQPYFSIGSVKMFFFSPNIFIVSCIRENMERTDGERWRRVTHTFQDYGVGARYVKFYHGGTDLLPINTAFLYISFADPDLDVKFHVKVRRKVSLPHIKTFSYFTVFFSSGMLRIRIRDPGSWMGKNSESGSGMNNPDHIS
jgi:hypothetical protein